MKHLTKFQKNNSSWWISSLKLGKESLLGHYLLTRFQTVLWRLSIRPSSTPMMNLFQYLSLMFPMYILLPSPYRMTSTITNSVLWKFLLLAVNKHKASNSQSEITWNFSQNSEDGNIHRANLGLEFRSPTTSSKQLLICLFVHSADLGVQVP